MPVTWLAIVLLVIFVLIIVAIFNPIIYAVEVVGRKPYKARFFVQWWGKMFRIHFAYEQGKPFFKEVYILRKAKLGDVRDYEDWLSRRVAEETAEPDEAKVYEEELEKTRMQPDEESEDTTPKRVIKSVRFDADGKPVETVEEVVEKSDDRIVMTDPTTGNIEGTVSPSELRAQNEAAAAKATRQAEKAAETDSEGKGDSAEATKTADEAGAKDNAKEKDPNKWWWVKHVTNGALYEKLLLFMKRCYNHSKPRQFEIEGQFGTGNPYQMGLTAAALYSIWPEKMTRVELSYVEPAFEGSLDMRGRISPGVLAFYGTLFAVSKPVRDLLIDAVKFALRYRKAQKAKKAAEGNDSDKKQDTDKNNKAKKAETKDKAAA